MTTRSDARLGPSQDVARRGRSGVRRRIARRGIVVAALFLSLGSLGSLGSLAMASAARAGYYLSAELHGPPAAFPPASSAMSEGTAQAMPPALPGIFVGHVDELAAAIAWIDRWAFAGPPLPGPDARELHRGPAPVPGGALLDGFGVHLLGLQIDEAGDDGSALGLRWPNPPPPVPERWRPAALLALRAPLFAAPAPTIPPAYERHDLVQRRDDLFVLGVVDRCAAAAGPPRCLRWAQVLARSGGRFIAGYLPAAQVALMDGWIRGKGGLPRIQVIAAGVADGSASIVVVVRTRKSELHQKTLRVPLRGEVIPKIAATVDGEVAILEVEGGEAIRLPLTAELDARPR